MAEFIYFEDSWNEPKKDDRGRKVLDGRTSPTREASDDSKSSQPK